VTSPMQRRPHASGSRTRRHPKITGSIGDPEKYSTVCRSPLWAIKWPISGKLPVEAHLQGTAVDSLMPTNDSWYRVVVDPSGQTRMFV
jgi:hypothetical protein